MFDWKIRLQSKEKTRGKLVKPIGIDQVVKMGWQFVLTIPFFSFFFLSCLDMDDKGSPKRQPSIPQKHGLKQEVLVLTFSHPPN